MRRFLFTLTFVVIALSGFAPPSLAQGALDGTDRSAIQQVILEQLQAFRSDDGAGAFALAAPGIRETFGTPETFMAMVREGYQPVYRPQVFEFTGAGVGPFGPEQRVYVVGPDGVAWIAVYPMEKQPDGRWLVNGCMLKKPEQV